MHLPPQLSAKNVSKLVSCSRWGTTAFSSRLQGGLHGIQRQEVDLAVLLEQQAARGAGKPGRGPGKARADLPERSCEHPGWQEQHRMTGKGEERTIEGHLSLSTMPK